MVFSFSGIVEKYPGPGGWFFVIVPKNIGEKIQKSAPKINNWGFVKVKMTLGKTSWESSIFPDKKHGFLIAIKADIRKKENINNGDKVKIKIEPIIPKGY
ncbi:MAG TPA: DUF1905 domain-containing protein [Alphaproteobacteria bacterium]|nr:DUF1905 domain-containing protein [Alphaproteobacteria bacterium]